jgi:NTE family protein
MIKNIVFSAGGLKGWAYIGAIRTLYEYTEFINIEHVIGTSIGSLFGLIYILQIDWKFVLDYFINLNIKEMIDIDIDNIITNQSIMKGEMYYNLIKEIMSTKVNSDITFIELYKLNNITFSVNAFNITKSKNEYFNFNISPNVKVIDAIMASSSIPLLLPPSKINGYYYYDGAICSTCSIDLVEELNTIVFNVDLFDYKNNNSNIQIMDLINALMVIAHKHMNVNIKNYVIFDLVPDEYKKDTLNINQTKDDIFNIYIHGYLRSKELLFNNFIALPPIIPTNAVG